MSFFRCGGRWARRFQLAASVGGLRTAAVGSEDGTPGILEDNVPVPFGTPNITDFPVSVSGDGAPRAATASPPSDPVCETGEVLRVLDFEVIATQGSSPMPEPVDVVYIKKKLARLKHDLANWAALEQSHIIRKRSRRAEHRAIGPAPRPNCAGLRK
jgi:hypothetical protein